MLFSSAERISRCPLFWRRFRIDSYERAALERLAGSGRFRFRRGVVCVPSRWGRPGEVDQAIRRIRRLREEKPNIIPTDAGKAKKTHNGDEGLPHTTLLQSAESAGGDDGADSEFTEKMSTDTDGPLKHKQSHTRSWCKLMPRFLIMPSTVHLFCLSLLLLSSVALAKGSLPNLLASLSHRFV